MLYRKGYKNQLHEDVSYAMKYAKIETKVSNDFITLCGRMLKIKKGYAWDGASKPAINTKNFIRASLVHDALYQLIREGHIPESMRLDADKELRHICRMDGMSAIRAKWVYHGVRLGGKKSATKGKTKKILEAP